MKNRNSIYLMLLLLCSFFSLKAQTNTQIISYKIAFKTGTTNCYEVSFKPNQALNATTNTKDKVSSSQVTVVAPAGTSTLITNLTGATGISFNPTSNLGNFEVNPFPGNANLEYITFGIKAFNPTSAANTDYLLFSFCLNSCTNLRLIDGVSPDSPFLGTYTGLTDAKPTSLDPYNSMSFNTGSPINLYEAYQGNNAGSASCAASPDLTTSISPASGTGTAGQNFNYNVCANNIGAGATTGSQTVSITLPTGLNYISGGNTTWGCTTSAGANGTTVVTCISSTAIAATSGTSCFPLVVQPQTASTSYTTNVTVAVTTGTAEVSTTNNPSSAILTTAGLPALITTVTGPTTGTIGVPITNTVNICNTGSSATTGTITSSVLVPKDMTYNTYGGNGVWTCTPASGPTAGPTTVTCTTSSSLLATTGCTSFTINQTPTATGTPTTTVTTTGGGATNPSSGTSTTNVGCSINAGVLTRN